MVGSAVPPAPRPRRPVGDAATAAPARGEQPARSPRIASSRYQPRPSRSAIAALPHADFLVD